MTTFRCLPGLAGAMIAMSLNSSLLSASEHDRITGDDIALQYNPTASGSHKPVAIMPALTFGVLKSTGNNSHKFVEGNRIMPVTGAEVLVSQGCFSWYTGYNYVRVSGNKNRVSSELTLSQIRLGGSWMFPVNPGTSFTGRLSFETLVAVTWSQGSLTLEDQFVSRKDSDNSPGFLTGIGLKKDQLFGSMAFSGFFRQSFSIASLNFKSINYKYDKINSETILGATYAL